MKKLLTLMLALGALSTAFAQRDQKKNNNDYDRNEYAYNRSGNDNFHERDEQLKKLNRDFDAKIQSVKMDRRLKRFEKERQISLLEKRRKQESDQLMAKFAQKRPARYEDGYAKNGRRN